MRRSYSLEAFSGGTRLEFDWDPVTGALTGRDAALVQVLADRAKRDGYCTGHPHPTPYTISDPLHRREELAVVLGNLWQLDPDLAAAYPRPAPADLPPGAIA